MEYMPLALSGALYILLYITVSITGTKTTVVHPSLPCSTGKRSIGGLLEDGVNAIMRYVLNNFADGVRQVSLPSLGGWVEAYLAPPSNCQCASWLLLVWDQAGGRIDTSCPWLGWNHAHFF